MPTDSFSPTGTVGPTWDEDSGVGHLSKAGLMVMLRLFFSLVKFNKSAYWIKEQPVRRGDRVKLWEKQRPLDSLRELLLALNSLPKLGLSQQFMTSWDLVSALLVLYFGMRSWVKMGYSWRWSNARIGFRLCQENIWLVLLGHNTSCILDKFVYLLSSREIGERINIQASVHLMWGSSFQKWQKKRGLNNRASLQNVIR